MLKEHVSQADMEQYIHAQQEATAARVGSITLEEALATQIDDQDTARFMAEQANGSRSYIAMNLKPVGKNESGEAVITRSGDNLEEQYGSLEASQSDLAEKEQRADKIEQWAQLIYEAGTNDEEDEDVQAINNVLDKFVNISSPQGIMELEKKQELLAQRIDGSIADMAGIKASKTSGLTEMLAYTGLLNGESENLRGDNPSIFNRFKHSRGHEALSEALNNPDSTFGEIVALAKEEAGKVVHRYQQEDAAQRYLLEAVKSGQKPTVEGLIESAPDSSMAEELMAQQEAN